MMVLKNKQVIANDSPRNLYENSPEQYVAALFDDVNEIYLEGEKRLLYPHQIKISENSTQKATVIRSYFKGFYWLIEARFNSQIIFFQNFEKIASKKEVSLSFIK